MTNDRDILAALATVMDPELGIDIVELGPVYRALMGRHFPAMAVVQVSGLVEREALVEIEATALLPD